VQFLEGIDDEGPTPRKRNQPGAIGDALDIDARSFGVGVNR
jgi:hypothetical protein